MVKRIPEIICLFLLVFLMPYLSIFGVYAQQKTGQDPVNEDIKQGIYQFRQENYDEALAILQEAMETYPDNPLAAYYLGLTYKRMEDYVAARKYLEASLHMTPKIKGALIELIDILYRLNYLDEAKKWISVAEEEGVRPAQAAFLKGLTLLKAGEYEESVNAFKDAKDLNKQLTVSADYQIGIAYLRQRKFNEAKRVFADIVDLDPHTDIATYAGRYVDAIDKRIESQRPLRLTLRCAFEYDSNVLLRPADTALVTEITDQDDTREVWDFKGEYTLRTEDNFLSFKAGYQATFSKQNDFGRYDVMSNTFSGQPAISFKKVLVTFPVNYSHSVVDEKNYVSIISVGNVNNILIAESQMVQTGIIYKYDDYLRPPFGDEDRTGDELIGTCGWFLFFMKNKGFLNVKYTSNKDWTEGRNWEYIGNKVSGGLLVPLWKFKCGVNSEVSFQNYDNIHSTYNLRRKDQTYAASSILSFEFIKNAEIQFQYTYVTSRSNINLYEYDRFVLSGALQYKF